MGRGYVKKQQLLMVICNIIYLLLLLECIDFIHMLCLNHERCVITNFTFIPFISCLHSFMNCQLRFDLYPLSHYSQIYGDPPEFKWSNFLTILPEIYNLDENNR